MNEEFQSIENLEETIIRCQKKYSQNADVLMNHKDNDLIINILTEENDKLLKEISFCQKKLKIKYKSIYNQAFNAKDDEIGKLNHY